MEQRKIFKSIQLSRGNLDGPFLAWLHSPEFASPAERLGAFCRYGTSLSLRESELLILCVAAHYRCDGEQQIHEPIALKSGIDEETIDLIRTLKTPTFEDDRMSILHMMAIQLLRTNRIDEELFDLAKKSFGNQALVEAIGIIGYYALVAFTLNAFEMGVAPKENSTI